MTTIAAISASPSSPFTGLHHQPGDALLSLIASYAADPRSDKMDLGVGVYRDERGNTPVLQSVKLAEQQLMQEQGTKSYLGAEGNKAFVALLGDLVFGPDMGGRPFHAALQTPGGTGALCMGAELIVRGSPGRSIWLGEPTWPNHAPIFQKAGVPIERYDYYDVAGMTVRYDALLQAMQRAQPGDIFLLHGCCHNPTGADLSPAQWQEIAGIMGARGLVPFVDLAYQGLGDGLEEDAAGVRAFLKAVPQAIVAVSCSKNFGLYRERTGALYVIADAADEAARCLENLVSLSRVFWSMPPDHGAAVVAAILGDPSLTALWQTELADMRQRLNGLRAQLAATHPALAPLASQRGMFATLPLSPEAVGSLRERFGVYMPLSGRINIAGLRAETVSRFADLILPLLSRRSA